MKYVVRAVSIDKKKKRPDVVREELVNIETNELFQGCKDFIDVANAYESFWSLDKYSEEKVVVLGVMPVKPEVNAGKRLCEVK